MEDILKFSDTEILALAKGLRVGYDMKRVLRFKTTRDKTIHSESNAEHIFALIYLASYFLQVEPAAKGLDAEKLYNILLYHDFGEIKYGDINTYDKTDKLVEREREAAKEIFASLPKPISSIGYEHWLDYEKQNSSESKFAYVLDKFEPLLELYDEINERSVKRLQITHSMHIKKHKAIGAFPVIKRFDDVITTDMHQRGVFWEKE